VKAALIPSRGYEQHALASDIHLALPLEDTRSNLQYSAYLRTARWRNDYIILDNGVAEGQLVDNDTLMMYGKMIGAHEVVAPDVMSDAEQTLALTKEFMDGLKSWENKPRIMGVLQGNGDELEVLLDEFEALGINTIGIPKVHVKSEGDDVRAKIADMIDFKYPDRFDIHLLGLNKVFPTEMKVIDFPTQIRSMDSAQPFKAAEADAQLSHSTGYHPRRADYFSVEVWTNPTLLHLNIITFKEWAARNESGESGS
jgi:hypothetical protein